MPAYDATLFNPPAPLALVTLRNREIGEGLSDVPMLLDSGADVTLIPQAAATSLGLVALPDKRYELIGYDGNTSFAQVVQLELLFCQKTFRGQFLLIDQEWGILGRNVLNAVRLLFDGPRLMWDEQR
ncbi:MAG TPA: retropepsin-like aspartic protease [Roseiflexaceae bacterium]|nr:retropepsin-like aspartic protease [Roseiflexaceae bacterium]